MYRDLFQIRRTMNGTLAAKVISYLLHPLLLPTLGLVMIFHLETSGLWAPPQDVQWYLIAVTFTATCLLPLLNALMLLRMRVISSLSMETRQERKLPYLAAAVFYLTESWLLTQGEVPVLARALLLGATMLVICVLLINLFWKISAHMVGIGGLCGMMLAVSYRLQINLHFFLILLFLLAGLSAYARLRLGAHTPSQVYAGFLLGVTVQLILFL